MITLLTDFGTADYFVPAVKGAILTLHPSATLIDITHEIPPHDIRSAAFTLNACYRNFPAGSVHLVVVDPGVGSVRRALVVKNAGHTFVGPDNGVFSFLYRQPDELSAFEVTREALLSHPVSPTFHGRDVFAPLAAQLDRGLDAKEVGPQIFDCVKFEIPHPRRDSPTGSIIGEIIHIDRFGNCITNLTATDFSRTLTGPFARFLIGSDDIALPGTHFAEVTEGGLVAYPGSAGFWEIGLWCQSAAARLGAERGTKVIVEIRSKVEEHR